MPDVLRRALAQYGCQSRIVPIGRIGDLREELDRFAQAEELNGFQRFIVEKLYRYDAPDIGFEPQSVVIAAAPSPAYANVTFTHAGETIPVKCLHPARIGGEAAPDALLSILQNLLSPKGLHVAPAHSLPLKRLAAASGLACYGRNNITYAEGMGSFFGYAAFFTDVPCEDGGWPGVRMAERCESCRICLAACPTGAIRQDRFLIDNERCLSAVNEVPGEFPDWVPADAHHTVYDCLRCQLACPMNRKFTGNTAGPFSFDEEETDLLLAGVKMNDLPEETRRKVEILGIDKWPEAVPRNLKTLFDRSSHGK